MLYEAEGQMFEAITAWATIAIAIGTLISVYVAYRGIRSQTRSFANSVSADLALKLLRDFESNENKQLRSRVAESFLKNIPVAATEDLFDKFEQIGFFARRGVLDSETAYSFFFHWVNLYWIAGKPVINSKRKGATQLWTDFELLYKTLLEIEIASDPRSRFINPSDELIKECLEGELE
jgi:hypothetical protein